MTTLIVAEKNKAAKAIAEALGKVNTIKKSKVNIYQVRNEDLYVIPLRGHILEYKNTGKYKSWSQSNPRNIITDPNSIQKTTKKYAYPYINALKEYAMKSDTCIISTDADVEGVNIGLFDAYPFINKANPKIKLFQMWLSSLQESEVLDKYNNLIPPKWSWGETGEARAIIDAIIGFSATREVTSIFKPLLQEYDIFFTSIGRVQTSLLYLIYLREKDINDFIPEPYYNIDATLDINSNNIIAHHELNPFRSQQKQTAFKIFQSIKTATQAEIINEKKEKKINKPPTPLNTSKALVLITKQLKISADLALKTLNSLYLKKIITYPRTDSDVYKDNFNHLQHLHDFSKHSIYGHYTSELIKNHRVNPSKGKKDAGDHPPITPILSLELENNQLKTNLERRVYDLVARYYLALFGENAIEYITGLHLRIKEEPFFSRLNSLIQEGYLHIAPFLKKKYDPEIILKNKFIPVRKITWNEKSTQPPPHYTDTTLLKLMESKNLGTKSTRPLMIEILQKRSLIHREKRKYHISDLGFFLIESLEQIWKPFLEPNFTSYVETELEKIKDQKNSMDKVLLSIKNTFLDLFDKLLDKKDEIHAMSVKYREKMQNTQQPTSEKISEAKRKRERNTSSKCPYCKKEVMTLINTKKKKRFLLCKNENCKKTILVPSKGRLNFLDSTCQKCGFMIIKVVRKKNNKTYSYYMCPYCWSEGLKESGKNSGKGFCSNCRNFKIVKDKCIKIEK